MRVAGWETGQPARQTDQNVVAGAGAASQQRVARTAQPPALSDSASQPQAQPKRKGFFERLRGIFK